MGKYPIASGGFGDVWKGTYGERHVAIKALRVYKLDDIHKASKVAFYTLAILESSVHVFSSFPGLLQGGHYVEAVVAS